MTRIVHIRNIAIVAILFASIHISSAQNIKGSVVTENLYSALLQNAAGEDPTRSVTIYLPPGYETSGKRYPVIYYLHGFTWSDVNMIKYDRFHELLDKAIALRRIEPVIVVMPNHHTLYRGSWYTNSSFTGRWADFTGIDLVSYIDKNYRTIANRDSRGVAGHSMGGQGALKMGMLFPDVFSSVYAMSPATLDANSEELGIRGDAYKRIGEITSREQLIDGWGEFLPNAIIAMGRAYTPNPSKPPFYADLPYEYLKDSLIIHYDILKVWREKSAMGMIDNHVEDLKKLTALKLDWGRNEDTAQIPRTSLAFSKKLENLGIHHYAEEYIGNHSNKLWTDDGRALNDMLPFFNTYLNFGK